MNNNDKLWTPDNIRQNASNWSLQSDAKLLEVMENISKTLTERGNRTTKNVHQMLLDLDETKITLQNTTNQLMSLQHKQFVENRVYDEDETLANTFNVPPKDESPKPKMSIIDALGNALESSVNMMDKYFDKVTFSLSDSDDDEDEGHRSVIYQPKDPYKNRPLPHLIGSKEWHEKWHVGLLLSDAEDNSDNENVDATSESSTESSSSDVAGSLSESGSPEKITVRKSTGPADIFNYSSDENSPRSSVGVPSDENRSNKPLNEPTVEPKLFDTSNSIFRPQKPITGIPHVAVNLIDSEPPDLDDSPIKKVGETKKPINLFMDDAENEDGFDVFDQNKTATVRLEEKPKVEAVSKIEETKPMKKAINLFADDDDDDFDTLLITPSINGQQTAKSTKVKNLFEDDDDDDDDFFSPPSEPVKEAKPSTSFNRPVFLSTQPKKDVFLCNLFDDEPPEDDFDMFKTKPTKKIEKSIKSIFGSSESIEETIQPKKMEKAASAEKEPENVIKKSVTNIFDEPENSGEIEVQSSPEISTKHEKPILVSAARPEPVPKAKPMISSKKPISKQDALRLFDDTPPHDDELFSSITTPVKKPVSPAIQTKVIKQFGEFYNDFTETVTEIEVKTKNIKISSTSLFSDESPSDEELFLSKPKAKKQLNEEVKESAKPTAPSAVPNDSEQNHSEFSKKLNKFANSSECEDTQDGPNKTVTQPKKLNLSKIDINVSALLPGAKRVMDKTEKVYESIKVSSPDTVSTALITKSISRNNVDESGRLINLNRDRAKVPSRRPSSRRGRQQKYQKSLDEDRTIDEVDSSDVVDESHEKSQVIEPKPSKVEPVKVESIEEEILKLELSNSLKVEEKGAIPSLIIPVPSDPFVDPEQSLIPVKNSEKEIINEVETRPTKEEEIIPQIPKTKCEPNEEEEDPIDFTEMDIKSSAKTKNSVSYDDFKEIIPTKPISKATPLFFDEIPPEDTFDTETFDKAGEKSSSSLLSKNALSLFGDDDADEDNFEDQLFAATLPETSNTQNEEIPTARDPFRESPPKLPSKQVSLFGDDNESDDDIFGGGSVKKKSTPITKPKEPETVPEISKQSTIVIEVPKETMPKQSSVNKTVPKSSLFDDISDDDDNLFGPPPIPNNESLKKSSTIKSATVSKSSKLFGDDSSDDDLFGSKPKEIQSTSSSSSTKAASLKTTPAVVKDLKNRNPITIDADRDPLAELLK